MASKTVNIEPSSNKETLQQVAELLAKMKNEGEKRDLNYEIEPILYDKISKHLKEYPGRFTDERNFVTRAIEILISWETDTPTAQDKMNERAPLIQQLAFMNAIGQTPEMIEALLYQHPNCYTINEKEVEQFLKDNEEYVIKGKKIQERMGAAMKSDKQTTTTIPIQEKERESNEDFEKLMQAIPDAFKFVKNINFKQIEPKDKQIQIDYDGWPLLWNYYTRILPAKIAITAIADIMNRDKIEVIELTEENKAHIYDITEELAKKVKDYETIKKVKRNSKLSIGLPKPIDSDTYSIMNNDEKKVILDSESRYKDRIIGKPRKNRSSENMTFDGMLSALGLVKAFYSEEDKKTFITLTEEGREFYLLKNPVINGDYTSAFSEEEREMLIEDILPKRDLEFKLNKTAVELIKEHSEQEAEGRFYHILDNGFYNTIKDYVKKENHNEAFGADILEQIIEKTDKIIEENKKKKKELSTNWKKKDAIQTPVQAYRVATMGRLSEMGVLEWKIKNDSSSTYEIADTKLAKELLK